MNEGERDIYCICVSNEVPYGTILYNIALLKVTDKDQKQPYAEAVDKRIITKGKNKDYGGLVAVRAHAPILLYSWHSVGYLLRNGVIQHFSPDVDLVQYTPMFYTSINLSTRAVFGRRATAMININIHNCTMTQVCGTVAARNSVRPRTLRS